MSIESYLEKRVNAKHIPGKFPIYSYILPEG